MTRIEEMTTVRATAAQARNALTNSSRLTSWIAPHVTLQPTSVSPTLTPGDRFRLDAPGAPAFDYLVEAVSDREVIFSFDGPWRGRERWSFIADGADTIVRRTYDVEQAGPLADIAWRTIGRALVIAHFKLELARFRDAAEREPGVRAEIEAPARPASATTFPIDEG